MKKLRIVSRNSKLAMWQASFVKDKLMAFYPDISIEIIGVTTRGDKILDRPLDEVGGKGLFIKELENSLFEQTADIAVHCLKDLPANTNSGFEIAAILAREDPADAFISNKCSSLDTMPAKSIIGTSSPRRSAILAEYYPQLQVKLLRGNINTRLEKLDSGEYDAIILAVAGLKRLGLDSRIQQKLDLEQFIPAIGQGALAVEVLNTRTDLIELLKLLNDEKTAVEVAAERMLGAKLSASCNVPIAIYAHIYGEKIQLSSKIWDIDANYYCEAKIQLDKDCYKDAVNYCAAELYSQGAKKILDKYAL